MSNAEPSSTNDTQAPRRRWLRRLVKIGLVLLIVLLLAPLALSLGPVRDMVADSIGDALGAKVTIESTSGYWFKGIDVEGLVVESPAGYEHPVARVRRLHVDVGIFGLIAGNLDAKVEITEPVVNIRRKPDGSSNIDPIQARLGEPKPETQESTGSVSIELALSGGVVDAQGAYGVEPTRLEEMHLSAALADDGGLRLVFGALAKNAKAGGGDASIDTEIALDGSGRGPWKIETSRLDLSRFSALLTGLDVLRSLAGELEISGSGRFVNEAEIQGTVQALADRLAGTTADGAQFGVARLAGTFEGGQGEAESPFTVDVDAEGVTFETKTETGTLRFAEPTVTIDAKGAYQGGQQRVVFREATITAGQSLNAKATKPWMVAFGDTPTAQGVASVSADFARLGSLRSLSPTLERLASGRLVANVDARQGEGLNVSIGARITGLSVTSPVPGGTPFTEPNLAIQARYGQVDAAQRIDIYRITSNAVSSTTISQTTPLEVHMKPSSIVLIGPVGIEVDLAALSLLVPDQLGLKPREWIEGRLALTGGAQGDATRSLLTATITGRGVRLPARWDPGRTPGTLEATLRADMSAADLKLELSSLSGFGFTNGTGSVRLVSEGDAMRLGPGTLTLGLNVAVARPWMRPLLGLGDRARIAGQVTAKVTAVEKDGGLALEGTSYAENVFWQPEPTDVALEDSRISMEHDIWLAPEGERSTLSKLTLAVTGLTVDASGSSVLQSDDGIDLDLKGTLRGDAARLAPTVASFMGPDYADMRGEGEIRGTFKATGNPAEGGRDLLADLALTAGSWTSGGLSIAKTQVNARRSALADPLALSFNAEFNKGPTSITGTYRPGPGKNPWTLLLNASRVDTSTLLVDRGPSRFLVFALPATLPSNAESPVLSGLMSARVNLLSSDLGGPGMLDDLSGSGHVDMQEGEIKNSTLFKGSDQGKLGALFKALAVAVSEVGDVVKSLTRALTFQTLESDFTVRDRRVNVQEARLSGRYVTLHTKGVVTFDQRVELETDLKLEGSAGRKAARILPSPTIPLRVTGKLPNTVVVPNLDPKKLLGTGLLDKAKDLIDKKKPKDVIKDLKDLIK